MKQTNTKAINGKDYLETPHCKDCGDKLILGVNMTEQSQWCDRCYYFD